MAIRGGRKTVTLVREYQAGQGDGVREHEHPEAEQVRPWRPPTVHVYPYGQETPRVGQRPLCSRRAGYAPVYCAQWSPGPARAARRSR